MTVNPVFQFQLLNWKDLYAVLCLSPSDSIRSFSKTEVAANLNTEFRDFIGAHLEYHISYMYRVYDKQLSGVQLNSQYQSGSHGRVIQTLLS